MKTTAGLRFLFFGCGAFLTIIFFFIAILDIDFRESRMKRKDFSLPKIRSSSDILWMVKNWKLKEIPSGYFDHSCRPNDQKSLCMPKK